MFIDFFHQSLTSVHRHRRSLRHSLRRSRQFDTAGSHLTIEIDPLTGSSSSFDIIATIG